MALEPVKSLADSRLPHSQDARCVGNAVAFDHSDEYTHGRQEIQSTH